MSSLTKCCGTRRINCCRTCCYDQVFMNMITSPCVQTTGNVKRMHGICVECRLFNIYMMGMWCWKLMLWRSENRHKIASKYYTVTSWTLIRLKEHKVLWSSILKCYFIHHLGVPAWLILLKYCSTQKTVYDFMIMRWRNEMED